MHRRPSGPRRRSAHRSCTALAPWILELVGGRYLLPYFVDDGARPPYRPEVIVWLADGEPVSYGIVDPDFPEPYRVCLQELVEAWGGADAIGTVRVSDQALAQAALGVLRHVPVTVGPVPELARAGRALPLPPPEDGQDRAADPADLDLIAAGVDLSDDEAVEAYMAAWLGPEAS